MNYHQQPRRKLRQIWWSNAFRPHGKIFCKRASLRQQHLPENSAVPDAPLQSGGRKRWTEAQAEEAAEVAAGQAEIEAEKKAKEARAKYMPKETVVEK